MSVAEVQASAGKFQRRIQGRNAREYVASVVMVAFFGFEFWRAGDLLVRIGFALMIAGICFLAWQLHARASWSPLPGDVGLSSYVEYKRRELERQRDALNSVWRWYLGPLIPGMAMLLVAFFRANPGHLKHPSFIVVPEAIFFAAISFGIARLNSNAARKLQKEIDELDEGTR
ncbi:MAG: hypothetical protein P4L26_12840 [Terracidiphilus sp.]|nr:hypothetical protein [Terracidiphilus sp.]